jgi:hypothetical protein
MSDLTHQAKAVGDEREQGAALVVVLVFMLGIVALVLLIVPPAQKNLESEALSNRRRGLEFVLQHAINDSLHECKDFNDYDAVANGQGAVGVLPRASWTAGGNFSDFGTGTPVVVNGRNLGAYMAVIRTDPVTDTQVLSVVAAFPDFVNPRELVSAQVQMQATLQGLFGDRSALSFAGNLAGTGSTGGGNFGWANNGDQTVSIKATTTYDPDGVGPLSPVYAPAVNISDSDFYDGFLTQFVNDPNHGEGAPDDGLDMEGGDIGDYTNTTTVITDTIAQEPSSTQRVNEEFLEQWIDHWRDAGNQTPDNTISSNSSWSNSASGTASSELTFLTASQLKSGNVIEGKGTLVIRGNLTMSNGAKINWDGDIIMVPSSSGSGQGKLIVKDAEINVTGGLVLAPDPNDNKTVGLYTDHEDAKVHVTGTMLAIQAGTGSAELSLSKGGELRVDGLLGMLGDNIAAQVVGAPGSAPGDPGRSKLDVSGSMVVAVPPGGSGLQKLRFDAASDATFEFDNAKFEAGVQLAEEGSQHSDVEPPPYQIYRTGYREVPATTVLAEFEALRIAGEDPGLTAP